MNALDLGNLKHGVHLIDDELQIVPEDIHRMFRRLRKAVDEIIRATQAAPKFMGPAANLPQPRVDEE